MSKNLSFKLSLVVSKHGKRFVAYSPALDISTSGKTEKEAKKRFSETVQIFLEEIFEAKTANEVLSELGWKKIQKVWVPPKIISSPYVSLSMPTMA